MAVLKLLRNQTLYETHDAALSAIKAKAEELGDGEIWIATYGTSPNAKSILAIKRSTGLTVFDNETSSDSITTAINKLDKTVGSTTVENGKHVAVQVVEEDGLLKSVTVTESDFASKTALDAEIVARKAVDGQTGDTYAANAGTNYIAEAKSLNDADVKLDAELKKEVDRAQKAEKEIATKVDKIKYNVDGTTLIVAGISLDETLKLPVQA